MIAPKRFCFAHALLPYWAIGEANAHCTHLQIAQAKPKPKFAKEYNFCRRFKEMYI